MQCECAVSRNKLLGEERRQDDSYLITHNSTLAAKSNATLDFDSKSALLYAQQHTQSRTTREVDRNERDVLVIS